MKRLVITCLFTLSVLITFIAFAESSASADFEINRYTIDSGGGMSAGGEFSLVGTIGQPDANRQVSTGAGFALAGGFWASATVLDAIFKDSFESD